MSNFSKTAVAERDPNDYVPQHRTSNNGETKSHFDIPDRAPGWGVAAQDGKFVLAQLHGGKWKKLLRNRDRSGKLRSSQTKPVAGVEQ